MKKRVVLKKGRYVVTRKGRIVLNLAEKLRKELKPFSKKIEVAGSIRRKEQNPVDIDIVLIPKNKEKILNLLNKKGRYLQGGEKRSAFKLKGIKVELYYAAKDNWGAFLLTYTGPSGYNIGLRTIAKQKGLLLNQYGLFHRNGKLIASRTEREIYKALGKKYKLPWLR